MKNGLVIKCGEVGEGGRAGGDKLCEGPDSLSNFPTGLRTSLCFIITNNN